MGEFFRGCRKPVLMTRVLKKLKEDGLVVVDTAVEEPTLGIPCPNVLWASEHGTFQAVITLKSGSNTCDKFCEFGAYFTYRGMKVSSDAIFKRNAFYSGTCGGELVLQSIGWLVPVKPDGFFHGREVAGFNIIFSIRAWIQFRGWVFPLAHLKIKIKKIRKIRLYRIPTWIRIPDLNFPKSITITEF